MGGCFWLIIMLFFFLVFGSWDLLLFMAVYLILIGVFYWLRSKKVDPVPKWEFVVAAFCSVALTLGIFIGFSEYRQYKERKESQEQLEEYKKLSSERRQQEVYAPPVTPSDEVHRSSSSTPSQEAVEEYDEDESEILDYDAGYEDGYQDGRWRSPGFSKRSYDYDYEDGYAQGYYDAAHDEPDYKEGEEYDW